MTSAKIINIPVDNTSIMDAVSKEAPKPIAEMPSGHDTKLRDGEEMPLVSPIFPTAGL